MIEGLETAMKWDGLKYLSCAMVGAMIFQEGNWRSNNDNPEALSSYYSFKKGEER